MHIPWDSLRGSIIDIINSSYLSVILISSIFLRWYGNNCICEDHCDSDACYEEDVNALVGFGFDSVKLDGCGAEVRNMDMIMMSFQ